MKDGENTVPAGEYSHLQHVTMCCAIRRTLVRLTPGQSITITPYLYHDFTVEPGGGPVLLGEVSQCNDDEHDNRFEPPYRLLCNEYPKAE